MAEIKVAQVWLTEEVLKRIKQHPRTSSGPVGAFVAIANTPENIEAIKAAARDEIKAHHKAKRALGVLWKDIDDVDAVLWVLGLTGGGE